MLFFMVVISDTLLIGMAFGVSHSMPSAAPNSSMQLLPPGSDENAKSVYN